MSQEKATFAAGCFWSVELVYQREPGVVKTEVGYIGGHKDKPTYNEVCRTDTGHAEAVQVTYDPEQVSFDRLLRIFWDKHDPTQLNAQGNDIGSQYRSAIFVHHPGHLDQAKASLQDEQKKHKKSIVTQILEAPTFFPAEPYHQQYLEKGGQSAKKGCTNRIRCYG